MGYSYRYENENSELLMAFLALVYMCLFALYERSFIHMQVSKVSCENLICYWQKLFIEVLK